MIKQKLQQKLLQKLSPQQIQLIKLLELPTLQLEQRIKKELEENPILEEGRENENEEYNYDDDNNDSNDGDEFSVDDYLNEEDIPTYKLNINNYSKDQKKTEVPYSEGITLHEYLTGQIGLHSLSEEQKLIAKYLIGNIDESGYLRRDPESISDDLAFAMNMEIGEDEINEILRVIQKFDPAGVGAQNLQECLIIQLNRKKEDSRISQIDIANAEQILTHYFEEFSKKHYTKISQKLGVGNDDLKNAVDLILKLNPKPGSSYTSSLNKGSQHITPDFVLEIVDSRPIISLNSGNVPELKISRTYSDMLKTIQTQKEKPSKEDKNTITFVKQKLDSAKWFIDAIKQRHNTLLLTINAIIDYQKEYFIEGDETLLRPMILKDIATITDLDISTISRVANSKYIQTHFGIFPLKYFFSEGMETKDGEHVSTREIKRILQDCIDNENKQKPLTDERLAQILQDKGYRIARRTVAKYREQLGILVARLRKKL